MKSSHAAFALAVSPNELGDALSRQESVVRIEVVPHPQPTRVLGAQRRECGAAGS